jgi:hypothetical protein
VGWLGLLEEDPSCPESASEGSSASRGGGDWEGEGGMGVVCSVMLLRGMECESSKEERLDGSCFYFAREMGFEMSQVMFRFGTFPSVAHS